MNQTRVAQGVPGAGQFAPGSHARSAVTLNEPADALPVETLDAINAEAADMPYSIGSRFVAARIREEGARAEADLLRVEAGRLREPATAAGSGAGMEDEVQAYVAASTPVPAEHPAFQSGLAVDTVSVDGTVYHRARAGVDFDQPYSMMLMADRPIDDDEMRQMAALAGYAYRSSVHGEPLGEPERVSPYAFTVYADTTKGRGYIGDFIQQYPGMVGGGSPVRMTERAGPGTKGTRLVEGMGESAPAVQMYFDSEPVG